MVRTLMWRCGSAAAVALCLTITPRAQARFSAHADLAVLQVAVTDRSGDYVPDLDRDAFTVFEDGVRQPLSVFSADDTPATIGLLIDDSTSMQGLRLQVTAAVATFVDLSNPADEMFALTFNESVRTVLPPQLPFTSDAGILRTSLHQAITARGRTALYDAIAQGVDGLQPGVHSRKALVIISDGGDNASIHTQAEVQRELTRSNTVVHAVALRNAADQEANPQLMKRLAAASGGLWFAPHDAAGIVQALRAIANDMRRTYTLAYEVPAGPPGLRHIRVEVRRDGRSLRARTRTEYLAR